MVKFRGSSRSLLFDWSVIALVGVGMATALFTGLMAYFRIQDAVRADDQRLLFAAEMSRELLGPTFHDRLEDADAITEAGFEALVARNDALCRRLDLQYLWSVLQLEDGRLVFTSATHSDLNDPESACARFFETHHDPEAFSAALAAEGQPVFSSFRNEWGDGRMVLLSHRDAQGRTYIHGASVQSERQAALIRSVLGAGLAVGAGVMALVCVPVIVLARRVTRPVARLIESAGRMSSGDLDAPLPVAGSRELKSLARSLDGMRTAVKEQMRAHSESEARFVQLARRSRTMLWETDALCKYTYMNDVAEEVLGYKPEELVGQYYSYELHPETGREAFKRVVFEIIERGEDFANLENPMLTRSGEIVWVDSSGMAVRDDAGRVVGYRGMDVDITHIKRFQEQVRMQTAMITSLMDSTPDLIFFKDVHGVYLGCNPAFADFAGYPREAIVGHSDMELFEPEVAQGFVANDQRMMARLAPRRNEEWVVSRSDGRRVLLDTLKTPYRGADGMVLGILGISRDITERSRVEQALRQQAQLQAILMELASTYISLPFDEVDRAFHQSLERLGRFVGADRAYIFDYRTDYSVSCNTHEWCAEGVRSVIDSLQELPMREMDRVVETHRRGGTVEITDVQAMAEGDPLRDELMRQEVRSVIMVPMMEVDRCLGFVGFDFIRAVHACGDDERRLLQVFAQMLVNIRVRHRAVLALEQSEEKWRSYIESAPYGILVSDHDGRILEANAQAGVMLGGESGKRIAGRLHDLFVPEQHPWVPDILAGLHEAGRADREVAFIREGGGRCWVALSAVCLREDRNLFFFADITERREAVAQLEMTKQSYLDVINAITDAIYIQNADGVFIEVNDGAARFYGCEREFLIGQTPLTLAAPGLNNLEETQRMSFEVLSTGVPARFDFWARRANGDVFPKEVVVHKGRFFGQDVLIATARDISDKRRLEEERERLQVQLMHAQKMESIGRLAGGIAHDFNNMLGVILGNAELALGRVSGDQALRTELQEIQQAGQRSADLTRKLLAFARRQVTEPRVLNLNETVDGLLSMLRRMIGEHATLVWRPDEREALVKMDPTQVDQILTNLCINARDAIRTTGTITIETMRVELQEQDCLDHAAANPGSYVRLSVRDNGCGMDPETLMRLFEPFFTTKPPGQGTGLGLSTVYGIVKQNEGFVDVTSTPGQGSRFDVYLPRCARREGLPEPAAVVEPENVVAGRGTILVVEDESTILHLVRRMLEKNGYRVLQATSSAEALDLVREHAQRVDLLLTDVVMPDMNGRALAGRIAQIHPSIRCLYMSGYTGDVMDSYGIHDHAANFIRKPFSMQDLLAKVRLVLAAPPA